jgi:hypothetical protein
VVDMGDDGEVADIYDGNRAHGGADNIRLRKRQGLRKSSLAIQVHPLQKHSCISLYVTYRGLLDSASSSISVSCG